MIVRGISDTPWHPNAYDAVIASDHAAKVVVYVVDHLTGAISPKPATFADLSPETNAKVAGYVVAKQAWFSVDPVTKVSYVTANGKTKTLAGSALKALEKEYTYGASTIKPVG
jgi:adenosylhomocysteine nucleosidase